LWTFGRRRVLQQESQHEPYSGSDQSVAQALMASTTALRTRPLSVSRYWMRAASTPRALRLRAEQLIRLIRVIHGPGHGFVYDAPQPRRGS
jgi:hypothetical protein